MPINCQSYASTVKKRIDTCPARIGKTSRQPFTNRRRFVHVTREPAYYVDRLPVSTVDDFTDLHNWIGTDWHRIDIGLT